MAVNVLSLVSSQIGNGLEAYFNPYSAYFKSLIISQFAFMTNFTVTFLT